MMDPSLDRHNSLLNNWRAHTRLMSLVEENSLSEIWRIRNPVLKGFPGQD